MRQLDVAAEAGGELGGGGDTRVVPIHGSLAGRAAVHAREGERVARRLRQALPGGLGRSVAVPEVKEGGEELRSFRVL
ncbi:hypothetical protein ACFQX4_26450 [Roseomonas sp. GCM10028921]